MKNLCARKLLTISAYYLIFQLACFGTLTASKVTFGQSSPNLKLPPNRSAYTLREFIDLTEQQSGYRFFFVQGEIKEDAQVKINPELKNLTEILDDVAKQTALQFKLLDDIIVIKKMDSAVPEARNQKPGEKTVAGRVIDNKGAPLPGVSIVVKGTTNGTLTNSDGVFSLNAPEDATLVFSLSG